MMNQVFNLLGSIVLLYGLGIAVSKKSATRGVLAAFFKGFMSVLKGAKN